MRTERSWQARAQIAFNAKLNTDPSLPQDFDVGSDYDPNTDDEDAEKTATDATARARKELCEKDIFFRMAVVDTARKRIEDSQYGRVLQDLERSRMGQEDLLSHLLSPPIHTHTRP